MNVCFLLKPVDKHQWLLRGFSVVSLLCLMFFTVNARNKGDERFTILQNGVNFQTEQGKLRVEFVSSDIVRVQYTKEKEFLGNGTIVCVPRTVKKVPFQVIQNGNDLSLLSDSLIVQVDLRNYAIKYKDVQSNRLLLAEKEINPREGERIYTENVIYNDDSKQIVKTADGEKEVKEVLRRDTIGYSWKYRNHFRWSEKEAIYGLGSHVEDYLNLRGKELHLCQHNLKAMVPVLNSTAGYGLLFDAGCGMLFKDKNKNSFIELEAAKQIDYYFMKGCTLDKVIGQYRLLTGQCPMMPRYIFGYIQSKERYKSSQEIIDVVTKYRQCQVPLDVIVQDWNYWPKGSWGYMKMDRNYYPSPANLADSIHALNAKLMVSIWPNPTNSPQTKDFITKGLMLERSVYDAFNPLARNLYWEYVNNEFFKNGFDAWWCDCSEPLDADWQNMPQDYSQHSHEERWKGNLKLLSDVLGAERSCLFSLYHSKGIYEKQRETSDRKRVVNLTRSSYAGQQRYSTITWNGDTHASWASFAQQIPAGLNFMATGCPYWTVDIGAFFTQRKSQWFWNGNYNQGVEDTGYREFYTRMFQYGAFLPLFRSHGTDTPREIWNFGKPGEPFYDSLLKTIHLRYRLLPYIYSLAGEISQNNYTISRLLAFDFADDSKVWDIKDQFMFGPAFLVCPVVTPMYYDNGAAIPEEKEKKRNVYLPEKTTWYDFYTGKAYEGGQVIKADAPIDRIPLFVRQGSIIPMGPVIQHTGELPGKELEIIVYPGKDTDFTLYEDEGDSYNYEQGAFTTIKLTWNDKKKVLTLGKRTGKFDAMDKIRSMRIVLHTPNEQKSSKSKVIRYSGEEVKCKF